MTVLEEQAFDPALFNERVELWAVRAPGRSAGHIWGLPQVNKLAYRQQRKAGHGALSVRSIVMESARPGEEPASSLLLLQPGVRPSEMPPDALAAIEAAGGQMVRHSLRVSYENWGYKDALRRLLPKDVTVPTSFEVVGHIVHFNLREEHWPHRHTIGRVCLDKNPSFRTAVAKLGAVSGELRTFDMEVIAGRNDTRVKMRENGFALEFDYRQVYWNSRLGEERLRVASQTMPGEAVYDLCAGVGALAVLCARQGCRVFANDLNPNAVSALKRNAARNGVKMEEITCSDMRVVLHRLMVPRDLPAVGAPPAAPLPGGAAPAEAAAPARAHLVMNLPELALDILCAAMSEAAGALPSAAQHDEEPRLFCVHCYCFAHSEKDVHARLEGALGCVAQGAIARPIRGVAPGKTMFCVEFSFFLMGLREIPGAGTPQESS